MKPAQRPVFLELLRIHLPITGWVSILHRVTGILLFLALPLGTWTLSVSLADDTGFRRVAEVAGHPLTRLLLLGAVWAFSHHVFAGLRHLALDAHCGTALGTARRSSAAVLLGAGLVTLFAAWRLFA